MRLSPRPWMTAPETRLLLAALAAAGVEARFVGGCVRDALLGRDTADIDLAAAAPPDVLLQACRAAGLRCLETGLGHGVLTVFAGARRFDIASLRRDVASDGRHAQVAFTQDWRQDAARRDFTFNALYLSLDGLVTDFFGGLADLRAGQVRFIGDPAARLGEDGLRLLRFYRFHACYGRGAPATAARAACAAAAPRLPRLSAERIRAELLKLLAAENPAPALAALLADGIGRWLSSAGPLPVVPGLGGNPWRDPLARLVRLERVVAIADPLRRLALLLAGTTAEGCARHARALRLGTAESARLVFLASAPLREIRFPGPDFYQLYDRAGPALLSDAVLIALACQQPGPWRPALRYARVTGRPCFPLRGQDALDLGIAPGPHLGQALATVRRSWTAEGFAPDRQECLKRLRAVLSCCPQTVPLSGQDAVMVSDNLPPAPGGLSGRNET